MTQVHSYYVTEAGHKWYSGCKQILALDSKLSLKIDVAPNKASELLYKGENIARLIERGREKPAKHIHCVWRNKQTQPAKRTLLILQITKNIPLAAKRVHSVQKQFIHSSLPQQLFTATNKK